MQARSEVDFLIKQLEGTQRGAKFLSTAASQAVDPALPGSWQLVYASNGTVVTRTAFARALFGLANLPGVGIDDIIQNLAVSEGAQLIFRPPSLFMAPIWGMSEKALGIAGKEVARERKRERESERKRQRQRGGGRERERERERVRERKRERVRERERFGRLFLCMCRGEMPNLSAMPVSAWGVDILIATAPRDSDYHCSYKLCIRARHRYGVHSAMVWVQGASWLTTAPILAWAPWGRGGWPSAGPGGAGEMASWHLWHLTHPACGWSGSSGPICQEGGFQR